jgi:hypothetical protein
MSRARRHCSVCGREQKCELLELAFDQPHDIAALCEEVRSQRCLLRSDVSVLDNQRFFVRGVLSLPVEGQQVHYNLGVWAEVGRATLARIEDLWDDPSQQHAPPFNGTLANRVPLVANSLGLSLDVRLSGATTRPFFEITDESHELYVEQHRGISERRMHDYTRQAFA